MLEGKSVLVVGVGTGLGREIASVAVRDGASVTIAARSEANLRTVAADLDPTGERVAHCATDIGDTAQLERLMGTVEDRFGGLQGLVICASNDTAMGGLATTSDEDWAKTFEINVFATARTVKAAVPLLKRQGGSVVFVGSQQWIYPARDMQQLAYGASKGAGISMMYALSQELGADKIRVNTVVPSWMWGPNVGLYVTWQAGVQGRPEAEIKADLDAKFALGEMATDHDVAETIGFFLSDRARSITGQSLLVNAGEARPLSTAHGQPGGDRAIRSYIRRGSRLSARQQQAWDTYGDRWVIAEAAQTSQGFRLPQVFEQPGPLIVEIGFGDGATLAAAAADRPADCLVGFEVWRPGVADCLAALATADLANVRLSTLDAAWCLEHIVDPQTVAELWTYFPDPWPKARHHKRRLVDAGFARIAASRLAPGGAWRLATDWPDYAQQIREVLDAEPALTGGISDRYDGRPLTRFERRGLAAGRPVTDLTYVRTSASPGQPH